MKNKIITSAFILLVLPLIAVNAQWEKIPLYGGHADRLVQSKFDSNLVFAIVKNSGIYYTNELYKNWKPLFKDELHPPFTDILDIEVTKNNTLLSIANKKCWRSTDWGINWQQLNVPYTGNAWIFSSLEASKSGIITAYFDGDQKIYHSDDDGLSWTTISFPDDLLAYRILGFYADPDSGKIIMLHGVLGTFARSIDQGKNWVVSHNFANRGDVFNPICFKRDGKSIYGIVQDVAIRYPELPFYRYFESNDTGKTWIQKSLDTLFDKNTVGPLNTRLVNCPSGRLLFCSKQEVYISDDSGKTWNVDRNKPIWDFFYSDNKLIASFTMYGIQFSTNEGNIWENPSSGFTSFISTEFKAASPQVFYAIVADEEEDQSSRFEFRQSTDAGQTWQALFSSPSLHKLNVISSPEIRYYLISTDHSIISGTVNQTVPDTLMTVGSNNTIYDLKQSIIYPEDFFVSASAGYYEQLFTSTNSGQSWEARSVPFNRYNGFFVFPSNVNRDILIGMGYETFGSVDLLCGLWFSNNHGSSWHQVTVSVQTPIAMIDNDLLFRGDQLSFSSDYGNTWARNVSGIEDSLKSQYFSFFTPQNELFITQGNGWYYYQNSQWNRLKDKTGVQIKRDSPDFIELVDQDLYCSFGYHGLYKIALNPLTSVKEQRDEIRIPELFQCYPNPFGAANLTDNPTTTIQFSLSRAEFVAIKIYNALGTEVETVVSDHYPVGTYQVTWNAKNYPGGVYFCRMIADKFSATKKLMLVR